MTRALNRSAKSHLACRTTQHSIQNSLLFAALLPALWLSPTAHADDAWVRSCNQSNNLAYCQQKDSSRGTGGSSAAQTAGTAASFGSAMQQTNAAWDSFSKPKDPNSRSLKDFAADYHESDEDKASRELRAQLSTKFGRLTYYGTLAGKGDGEIDFKYAMAMSDDTPQQQALKSKWIQSAANNGSPRGMYMLSHMYANGYLAVEKDQAKHYEYLQKASAAGQGTARGLWAEYLALGTSDGVVKADPAAGFALAKSACEQESLYGCYVLGTLYEYGVGTPASDAAAAKIYEQILAFTPTSKTPLSLQGEAISTAYRLAMILVEGETGVPANLDRARSLLLQAINNPGPRQYEPWLEYANALILGYKGPFKLALDHDKGLEILQWFADRNFTDAMDTLGSLYLAEEHYIPKNEAKGVALLEKAIAQNSAKAMHHLAGYYATQKQYAKALPLLQKAADLKYPAAIWQLALYHEQSLGVPKDHAKFLTLGNQACALAAAEACYEIGFMEIEGTEGMTQNKAAGMAKLNVAAEHGHTGAMMDLSNYASAVKDYATSLRWAAKAREYGSGQGAWIESLHYLQGLGMAPEVKKAIPLMVKACELDNQDACFAAGKRFLDGLDGFPQDLLEARRLVQKMRDNGSAIAAFIQARTYIEDPKMTAADAETAVHLAQEAQAGGFEDAGGMLDFMANSPNKKLSNAFKKVSAGK